MRFWDSSALVPLLVEEDRSSSMRDLLRSDYLIVAAPITPIEVAASLWRGRHANQLDARAHIEADERFAFISRQWIEIDDWDGITETALSLLSRHQLRTADATQLAAALIGISRISTVAFGTLDSRLATAARAEGFTVLP